MLLLFPHLAWAGGESRKFAHRTTSAFWFWKSDAWGAEVLVERYARDPAPWYAEGYVQKRIGERLSLGLFAQEDSGWGPRFSYAVDENIEVWVSLLARRVRDSAWRSSVSWCRFEDGCGG